MSKAHERKKQPEVVRRNLIDSTIAIAAERGYEAVTVQAVADAAGVTKGGLMHHFGSKFELVDAAFQAMMEHFDEAIADFLKQEARSYGAFTRAYIRAVLTQPLTPEERRLVLAVPAMVLGEPELRHYWSCCHSRWLQDYGDTDDHLDLRLLRAAADGLWWDTLISPDSLPNLDQLIQTLLQKTYR